MNRSLVALASTALVSVGLMLPTSATAAPVVSPPIVTGLAGPLQIDVGSSGQVYVGQAFAGVLTKVRPDGTTKTLVTAPGQEISGVASRGNDVVFTVTGGDAAHPVALLRQRLANGTVRTLADLYAYEKKNNPDAINTYGFRRLSAACAAQVPADIGGTPYTGRVDSHPYAVTNAPDGGWYVADAAANDILKVEPDGHVSTAAVMHDQDVILTTGMVAALGLPTCTIGAKYSFEPVPTDVELAAPDGQQLFVSLLPGGPEDSSLGNRGQIVRIYGCDGPCNEYPYPDLTGDQWVKVNGLAGATNLAVAATGGIYVTELFADRISLVKGRTVSWVATLPSPAAIEWANGRLYVAYDVYGAGAIATITP